MKVHQNRHSFKIFLLRKKKYPEFFPGALKELFSHLYEKE